MVVGGGVVGINSPPGATDENRLGLSANVAAGGDTASLDLGVFAGFPNKGVGPPENSPVANGASLPNSGSVFYD